MSDEQPLCELCGEPMPKGEEMFKFHGYSGPCPKPPIVKAASSVGEKMDMNMAFEDWFGDDPPKVLYRIVYWQRHGKRRLRSTNYYARHSDAQSKLERIDTEDLILVQEFKLTAK